MGMGRERINTPARAQTPPRNLPISVWGFLKTKWIYSEDSFVSKIVKNGVSLEKWLNTGIFTNKTDEWKVNLFLSLHRGLTEKVKIQTFCKVIAWFYFLNDFCSNQLLCTFSALLLTVCTCSIIANLLLWPTVVMVNNPHQQLSRKDHLAPKKHNSQNSTVVQSLKNPKIT